MKVRENQTGKAIFFLTATLLITLILTSCDPSKRKSTALQREADAIEEITVTARDSTQEIFWCELQKLKGKAFEGTIISAPANDTIFAGTRLLMHILSCEQDVVNIPFFVGNDSSRTWVFTKDETGIILKHDHRHPDGTPDKLTMYGGKTQNYGSCISQIFPADQETAEMIPGAITNVWWIDFVPGDYFTYNLRRINTDRIFSIKFDLKREVDTPGKPWGWS
jgi:hypothetical protein